MKWVDNLERKFGKYAVSNLMYYIIGLNLIGLVVVTLFNRGDILSFNRTAFLHGEYWRIVTFIFYPPSTSLIFAAFVLYFYYMIGSSLESYWGTFKFNIYYFIGAICTLLSGFITGQTVNTYYLNMSLFLAFATIFPNFEILLFFILPIKMKYLAWLDVLLLCYDFLYGGNGVKTMIFVSFLNYLLFFGNRLFTKQKSNIRKQSYAHKIKDTRKTMHKCTVCGRTEEDDENLEFRYCSKCEGHYEYCSDHLFSHEHITSKNSTKK